VSENIKEFIQKEIDVRNKILSSPNQMDKIKKIASVIKKGIVGDKKTIAFCGNGGSATMSSHMMAEMVNRYTDKTRMSLSSVSFNDPAVLSSISNDYDFNNIFSFQIEAKLKKGDILVGFSTSGNSKNIIEAIKTANSMGIVSIAIIGEKGSLNDSQLANYTIEVPSCETPIIQSVHLMIGHIICGEIESAVLEQK
jgi:D-sedoheptulose 7-phosphate isomerase